MSGTINLPDFATHYHHASDPPFKNLSDLDKNDLVIVLEKLKRRGEAEPTNKRVFGSAYMPFRAETENKMRELFVAEGGAPERKYPHYFVLGECPWFASLYPDSKEVKIRLAGLDPKVVSFTYPDSFIAMRLGEKYGLPAQPLEPYHNRVFLLSELEGIVKKHGLPDGADDCYDNYHKRKFEKYIEIQVWSDHPISEFLEVV